MDCHLSLITILEAGEGQPQLYVQNGSENLNQVIIDFLDPSATAGVRHGNSGIWINPEECNSARLQLIRRRYFDHRVCLVKCV